MAGLDEYPATALRRTANADINLQKEETWNLEQVENNMQARLGKIQNTDHRVIKTAPEGKRKYQPKTKADNRLATSKG